MAMKNAAGEQSDPYDTITYLSIWDVIEMVPERTTARFQDLLSSFKRYTSNQQEVVILV
jgi:hypothetical protein